ncbi:MAG: tetratricopeptide repeat protein [Phycisphaerae bacterium]|nr:tetratricopeptide repeat protein [Phycisphaerae bacterium]
MCKSVIYTLLGLAAAVGVLVIVLIVRGRYDSQSDRILAAYEEGKDYGGLTILYPLDETLFPPEIAPPTFRWRDNQVDSDEWLITFKFQDGDGPVNARIGETQWTPSSDQWEAIKRRSREKKATVTILAVNQAERETILSGASISISTSRDEVGAPLFYREVILPFIKAVQDPSRLRWRFGEISSAQRPPIVMEKLPVCGNCHSFSADGSTLGMDVDYANSKGSYVIQATAEEMYLKKDNIITWDDYKKEEDEFTFGLLSQISPDGKYAISTVKDRSVFIPRPDLAFSQLFFPIKGILVVYNRQTRTFKALPGADDKQLVQSNPVWSPDGKHIVFARNKVYHIKHVRDRKAVLLNAEESREFVKEGKTFLFDLYRIPFNGGKGGKPLPLRGASHNGASNYFAKYSPDGKWIVFCKAKSFMLLQPDSELYIIPAAGGEARRLRCNTSRMNSWHSWSPNSRWLVFSSKPDSPYTQLFLTHINEEGRSSPPVVLSWFTAPDRAANIPEFVNTKPLAIRGIHEKFVDDFSYARVGHQSLLEGDYAIAIKAYRQALKLNPKNADIHARLGAILGSTGASDEAKKHLSRAIELRPDDSRSHRNFGIELEQQGMHLAAMTKYRQALRVDPKFVEARISLASALMRLGNHKEAESHLSEAVRIRPDDHMLRYFLGRTMRKQGKMIEAVKEYRKALSIRPDHMASRFELGQVLVNENQAAEAEEHFVIAIKSKPNAKDLHFFLGISLVRQKKLEPAVSAFRKELSIQPNHPYAHSELAKVLLDLDQAPQAGKHLAAAIKINPRVPDFHLRMARIQQRSGRTRGAIGSYRRAIELKGDLVAALSELAWIYSTHASREIRNSKQAVAMAKRASELAGGQAPVQLDTLAAAFAEAGQFTEAVETASKAAGLADKTGDADLAKRIRNRLSLYRAGKPFRTPAP